MNVQSWMIAVLLAVVCSFGMLTVARDMQSTYGVTEFDNSYSNTFDKVDDVLSIQENMTDSFVAIDIDAGLASFAIDLFNAGWRGAYGVIKILLSTIGILHAIIVDSGLVIGVPPLFTNVFMGILTITILTILASILMKFEVNK